MIRELRIMSAAIAGCVALGSFYPAISVLADDDLSSIQSNSDIDLGYDILTPTEEWSDNTETIADNSPDYESAGEVETDTEANNEDINTDISSFYNEVFSSCMTNAANKTDISGTLSNMNSVFSGNTQIAVGSYQLFDLSGTDLENNVDLSVLNLQYAGLSLDLVESQVDLSGSSTNAVSLFNNTYGDLVSQLTLESPSIPESFSSQDMIALGQEAINSTKSSVLSSDTFQTVKNNIDISSVVSTAKNGLANTVLNADNLQSSSELASTLSDVSTYASKNISGENKQNENEVNTAKQSNDNKLSSVVSAISNYTDLDADLSDDKKISMGTAYQRVTQGKYRTDLFTNTWDNISDFFNSKAIKQEEIKQAYNNGEISKQEAVYQMASNPAFYGPQEELSDTGYVDVNNLDP